jgi:transposase-like protein
LIAERDLSAPHTSIWRWTQLYSPELLYRLHEHVKLKSSTCNMDETPVGVGGRWMYLFGAADSGGQTVDFYLSEARDREATASLCVGWSAKQSGSHPRVSRTRSSTSTLPATDATLLQ